MPDFSGILQLLYPCLIFQGYASAAVSMPDVAAAVSIPDVAAAVSIPDFSGVFFSCSIHS
jgi:hypothetical protein